MLFSTSECPHKQLCADIQAKRPPFSERDAGMLMTLSFSSCMHIQIKWEPMLWLSMLPSWKQLSYLPIKRFRISPVMSCPSLSRIKTRAVRASAVSPAQGLPTVRWADAGMIMPSPGLMSLSKSSPTAVVSHASLSGLALNAWLRCWFFFFFFLLQYETRIQSNPVSVLTLLVSQHAFVSVPNVDELHASIDAASTRFLQFQDALIFFICSLRLFLLFFDFSPLQYFTPKGCYFIRWLFFSVRELSSRKLSLWLKRRYIYKTNHSFF